MDPYTPLQPNTALWITRIEIVCIIFRTGKGLPKTHVRVTSSVISSMSSP